MPTLHVRSVPEELYNRLHNLAHEQNRSLSAQVITLLDKAVKEEELRLQRAVALNSIRRRRYLAPADLQDSLSLLREDRSR